MYFFRITISSFDDAEETLYIIPDQTADEQGVPFNEKILTQTAEYKAFVKETGTSIVDGEYTQYEIEGGYERLNDKLFAKMQAEGTIKELDSNTFYISTGYKSKKPGGGKLDLKTFLLIGGFALVAVLLLIASGTLGGKNSEAPPSVESTEIVESTESTESSEPDTVTDSDTSETNSDTSDSTEESAESAVPETPADSTPSESNSDASDSTEENAESDVPETSADSSPSESNSDTSDSTEESTESADPDTAESGTDTSDSTSAPEQSDVIPEAPADGVLD